MTAMPLAQLSRLRFAEAYHIHLVLARDSLLEQAGAYVSLFCPSPVPSDILLDGAYRVAERDLHQVQQSWQVNRPYGSTVVLTVKSLYDVLLKLAFLEGGFEEGILALESDTIRHCTFANAENDRSSVGTGVQDSPLLKLNIDDCQLHFPQSWITGVLSWRQSKGTWESLCAHAEDARKLQIACHHRLFAA